MQGFELKDMLSRRTKLLDTMSNHFQQIAPIKPLPIPRKVASSEWFNDCGVTKILQPYGLMCSMIPGYSGKLVAAFKILLNLQDTGILDSRPTLVAATSGNFGYAMAMLTVSRSPMFDIPKFIAVVDSTVSQGKLDHLALSRATIVVAPERVKPVDYADQLGKQPGHFTINQYVDIGNVDGQKWVADAIHGALGSKVSVFAAAVGSTATVAGADYYLRDLVGSHLKIIGVASRSEAEKVPGSRTKAGLSITAFGYEDLLDYPLVEGVSLFEAFDTSEELLHSGLSVGPTSGLALAGFYKVLEQECKAGRSNSMANRDGNILPVILCMDQPMPYASDYRKVLGY